MKNIRQGLEALVGELQRKAKARVEEDTERSKGVGYGLEQAARRINLVLDSYQGPQRETKSDE